MTTPLPLCILNSACRTDLINRHLQNRSDKQSELLLVLPSTLNDHSSSPVHSQLSLQNRSDKQSELLLVLPSTLNDHSSPPVYSQLSLQNRSDKQSELLLVLPSTLNDHSSSPVHSQLSLQNRSDKQLELLLVLPSVLTNSRHVFPFQINTLGEVMCPLLLVYNVLCLLLNLN
ncbi:hypothetical protein J6590_067304 [Homalodisca vitripennis]|nr:hypothetical protein J6590_067304 [Homalodisca vitripennis]